jgi:hypothetical protein
MKGDVALWTGLLAGPTIWLISFGARWSLSGWICVMHWKPALFVITVVSLLLVAACGKLSWSEWQRVGCEMPGEGGGSIPRARIMAVMGLALNALSILLIVAQAIPDFMLGACE